jgi:D-aminopeptidase
VGEELKNHYMASDVPYDVDGSVMIIVATDAPLLSRNLERLAKRALLGIARVGGFASNGSGDYVIAFSTSEDVRIETGKSGATQKYTELENSATTPLFLAAVEATEEAILNSLFMAITITGDRGHTQEALPIPEIFEIMNKYNLLEN